MLSSWTTSVPFQVWDVPRPQFCAWAWSKVVWTPCSGHRSLAVYQTDRHQSHPGAVSVKSARVDV